MGAMASKNASASAPVARRMLSASADAPAYSGDFTRTLIEVLRRGVPTAGGNVDARYLREPLQRGAKRQQPQRVTVDGGGWAQTGDEGLWLAHNAALRHLDGLYIHNEHTRRGDLLHERADTAGVERRPGVRTERGLWIGCDT